MSTRRSSIPCLAVVLAACGGAPVACGGAPVADGGALVTVGGRAVPIELFGADAEAIVVRCQVTSAGEHAETGCWRATSATQVAELLRGLGGDAAAPDRDDVVLVAVVEPGPPRLERVVIGSEEGVDVLTLVLGAAPAVAAAAARTAMLLWVERRPHQLAVVRRDVPADTELTVGIFDGR